MSADAIHKWRIRYKDRNRMSHQIDSSELLEIYLTSLTKTFDPHSSYLSAQEPGGHAQPVAPPLAGRDRRLAPVRGRICGRSRGRAGDGR